MTLKNRYLLYKVRTFIDDFEEDENIVRDWTLCYDRKQDKVIPIRDEDVVVPYLFAFNDSLSWRALIDRFGEEKLKNLILDSRS